MEEETVFKINKPIEMVKEFKYLGQIVTQDDNDETAVKRNIVRAREKWVSMRRFLIVDDVDPKTMSVFYRTVVLSVLLYGSESWVLTTDMMRQLRSFHRRCCRGITRDFIHQDEESGSYQATKRCSRKLAFWQLRSTYKGGGIRFYLMQGLQIYMEGVRTRRN
jgi:hypothetical protein